MLPDELFRVEYRIQNGVAKYYLVREIFSDSRKFSASRLITSGTPPTKAQTGRCASLYGFDLELKCIAKAARYRISHFTFDTTDGGDEVFELERYRLLQARKASLQTKNRYPAEFIAAAPGVDATPDEIYEMFASGTLPKGSTLSSVNVLQNLYAVIAGSEKKPVNTARVVRIQKTLCLNLRTPEITDIQRESLNLLFQRFYQRIHSGFYPFEQCLEVYGNLKSLFPDDPMLVYAVYGELLDNFGYRLLLPYAESMESALAYVHQYNSELEHEVRKLNEQRFRVKAGGKQKRLELFF